MTKRLFAAGVLLSVALIGATASIALAHSRPVRFSIAPGSVLTTAPTQLSGWFTSELRQDPNWTFLHVTDAQGNRVDTGAATLSTDRLSMSVNLKSGLSDGMYIVAWRTYDDGDGEIFGDCYTFFVGQAAADQAARDKSRLDAGETCQALEVDGKEATPTAAQVDEAVKAASEEGEDSGSSSSGVPVWALVVGIGVGVVVGGVGGRLLGSRSS